MKGVSSMCIPGLSVRQLAIALAAGICVILAACGSDQVAGIEGSGAPVASSPVTTTGKITGFGSILVDGVEYETSSAQIRIDDQPATEADLRAGHVVTIKGSLNADGRTGAAREVTFSSAALGTVSQVNEASSTFTVLGQTVAVTGETLFDESTGARSLSELQSGKKVRVSGFPDETGVLVASRVDAADAPVAAELQVRGKVRNLDVVARTFRINSLTVDYASASVSGTVADGSFATVRGSNGVAEGTLTATQVSIEASPAGAANEKGQVEGLITSFTSAADFVVDSQPVVTTSSTQLELNGATLGANVFVKVRGTFNAGGALVAEKIEARASTIGLLRGPVDSVSSQATGSLVIMGVTATISSGTTFEDRSNERKRPFRLSDVRADDYVEVRGRFAGSAVSASIVQRDKPENRLYVEGVATDVAQPAFKVLGVSVITNDATRFIGLGGSSKGAAVFFGQAADEVVSVRGTMSGNTLVADQVRIGK
jgi:hypothetical protein